MNRAFTLIELVVCIAIFAMMTALVIAKYGTFNQSVLLTDLAYDTAITVRTAQTYGLSVQQQGSSFQYPYGVDFCASSCNTVGSVTPANNLLVLFADTNINGNTIGDGVYDNNDIEESMYTITRGAVIAGFCLNSNGCSGSYGTDGVITRLDVTFKRPNPDAIICVNGNTSLCNNPYAAVIIKGTDDSIRQVIIRNTGQVSVQE